MNAQAKVQPPRNQVTIRPERLVVARPAEGLPPDRPYTRFQRLMLTVMGTLRGRKLI